MPHNATTCVDSDATSVRFWKVLLCDCLNYHACTKTIVRPVLWYVSHRPNKQSIPGRNMGITIYIRFDKRQCQLRLDIHTRPTYGIVKRPSWIEYTGQAQGSKVRKPIRERSTAAGASLAPFAHPLILIACVGSYGEGTVVLVVPFQQYLEKQFWHVDGISVCVFQKLRASIAHPTQDAHSLSKVPLPLVATL